MSIYRSSKLILILFFQILSPNCPSGSVYCFDTNECSTSCVNVLETACSVGLQFCSLTSQCWDASSPAICPSTDRYSATSPNTNFKIDHIVPLTISQTGFQYFSIDLSIHDINVSPGHIIGFQESAGQATIATGTCDPKLIDFRLIGSTPVVDAILTTFGSIDGADKTHLLKAIVSSGTTASLNYNFATTDSVVVGVKVVSDRLGDVAENSTTIHILEGINYAILDVPLYVVTSVNVDFTTKEHTGELR